MTIITISPLSNSTIAEFTILFTLGAIQASKYTRKYRFTASKKTVYSSSQRFIILPGSKTYRLSSKESFYILPHFYSD
jgi:hypothetical protein